MSSVQSIERAFSVISALADEPLGVTDVASRARLPKSTAARLLTTLAGEGVVEQVPGETRYRLGPRLLTLAAGLRPTRGLVATAHPHLVELADVTGEAAGLSVPDGRTIHYIDQVDSPNPVQVRDWTGARVPLHVVSSGQVVLAYRSASEVARYLGQPLERFTGSTITDPGTLLERLRDVRSSGVSWVREEFAEGITSVAAPIAGPDGEVVAAVHVHGPSYRFPASAEAEASASAAVLSAAARIGERLRA